jgi:hypothetical protein
MFAAVASVALLVGVLGAVLVEVWFSRRHGLPPTRDEREATAGAECGRVIQVEAGCPAGMSRRIARDVSVAGISRPEHREAASEFVIGSDQVLMLEREPSNSEDRNPIAVIGTWKDCATGAVRSQYLGYLPRDVASEIAVETRETDPLAASIWLMFKAVEGKQSPGLLFDIWTTERPYALRQSRARKVK